MKEGNEKTLRTARLIMIPAVASLCGSLLNGCAPDRVDTLKIFPVFEHAVDRTPEENLAQMEAFQGTFGNGSESVNVGFGDVLRIMEEDAYGADKDYDFNPERFNKLTELSIDTGVPVAFYIQAGGGAVKYPPTSGSLTEMLISDSQNMMWYADNNPVKPYSDGVDGLTNLTLDNEGEVGYYREKNIKQLAALIEGFRQEHPDLFGGVSVSGEVGFAFPDEAHGWTGYEPAIVEAFRKEYGIEPPRVEGDTLWKEWIKFRQEIVDKYVQQEVDWVHSAGIPTDLIYTQQVLPDWAEGRQITGNTWEAAEVDDGTMGLSIYMYGDWFNKDNLKEAYEMHNGVGWGAMCLAPSDFNNYDMASDMLWDAYNNGAGFIGPYGWFPYNTDMEFDQLGDLVINGTEYERAVRDFINDLE